MKAAWGFAICACAFAHDGARVGEFIFLALSLFAAVSVMLAEHAEKMDERDAARPEAGKDGSK